jgi:hypothetical protein
LGCYKPSPLKGISSSRFVGVAQNYTHSFSKISGLGKTMHGCITTETRISRDRLHCWGSPFLERREIHFSKNANITSMNSGSPADMWDQGPLSASSSSSSGNLRSPAVVLLRVELGLCASSP